VVLALSKGAAWQPGWQTADDLRDEWYEVHGWITEPPPQTVEEWEAVQRAEDEYRRGKAQATGDDQAHMAGDIAAECTVSCEIDPALFVPARPQFDDSQGDIAVELFQLATGQPVVMAFSSAEILVDRLGPYQPWLCLPGETIVSMSGGILLVDPSRDVVQPMWTEERLNALKDAVNDRL
jgi:hypothetical protein